MHSFFPAARHLCFVALAILALGCGSDPAAPDAGEDPIIGGPPAPGEDGAACRSSIDCFSGTCLSELESGMPSGYCTAYDCIDSGDCSGGSCYDAEGRSACLDECSGPADCRSGYDCIDFGGVRFCDLDGVPSNEVGESPGGQCLQGCEVGDPVRIDCGFTPSRQVQGSTSQWGLPYRLTQGVDGFALSVWADGGSDQINVVSVRNSDDVALALKGADSALNITSFFDNDFVTVTFPWAPAYADYLEGASGLLQVQSTADRLCVARSEGLEGTHLTLHVYLVGASGLTIDGLSVDPDARSMLDEVRRLFGLAGIVVDRVVPHPVDEAAAQAYRIIREQEDIDAVLELTEDPALEESARPDDALVLNLVLVDDIMLTNGAETIGQAGLLPGPPGIHGTAVSGVVAETVSLRERPEYLALIVVHEAAHFLGLRHTSELFTTDTAFGRVDPLDDTRECPDVAALLETCPDYHNLMFPLAPPGRDSERLEITDDQAWVLRHNPLLR